MIDHSKCVYPQLIIKQLNMNQPIPLLHYDQISQLNTIIYNIQDQNKRQLDELLSEQTSPQNTSVLNLYHLTTQQWSKKQTTIDNMCRFTLTVMASLELMWQQKHQRDSEIDQIQEHVIELERQLAQLQEQNETYIAKLAKAEKRLEETTCEKEKAEELYRTQSCTGFTLRQQEGDTASIMKEETEQLSQLQQSHKELQKRVSQLQQEKQLAKMQIELAQIALKDAIQYKSSFEQLLNKTSSRIDPITQTQLHVLDIDQSVLSHQGSFRREHRQLSKELPYGQGGVNYFASTPCLFFENDEEAKNMNRSHSQHFDFNLTPFKKKEEKVEQLMGELAQPSLESNISINRRIVSQQNKDANQSNEVPQEQKELGLESSISNGLKYYRPSSSDDRKLNQMIARLKIKQSDSFIREDENSQEQRRWRWETDNNEERVGESENSFSRFYNYLSSKVITNRIKKK